MLEFTSQENGNQNLLNSSLNGNDSDDTQNGVRSIPKFKEPL